MRFVVTEIPCVIFLLGSCPWLRKARANVQSPLNRFWFLPSVSDGLLPDTVSWLIEQVSCTLNILSLYLHLKSINQ